MLSKKMMSINRPGKTIRLGAGPVRSLTIPPLAIYRFRQHFARHLISVMTGPVKMMSNELLLGNLHILSGAVALKPNPGLLRANGIDLRIGYTVF